MNLGHSFVKTTTRVCMMSFKYIFIMFKQSAQSVKGNIEETGMLTSKDLKEDK